jgi:hypothetical protein
VLDLAERLGARYVTAAGVPADSQLMSPTDEFQRLVADCDDYQLIPSLVAVSGTGVATTAEALRIARATTGSVVLTVSTGQSALEIEAQVLDAGNRLGYLRLLAEELDATTENVAGGLLATVPVHVPIAVGSLADGTGPDHRLPEKGDAAGLASRARRWSWLIDRMLEHPLAKDRRLRAEQTTR